jgi:hypothetical protein
MVKVIRSCALNLDVCLDLTLCTIHEPFVSLNLSSFQA